MQQLIDCTMLCPPSARTWAQQWVAGLADDRLRVRLVHVAEDVGTALEAIRTPLQTAHLCLLPVCADNLSWVRTLLGRVAESLFVPVIAITSGLKAAALRDLFALRVADFIRASGCPDELRVRVERVLMQARTTQLHTLSQSLGSAMPAPATRGLADAAPDREPCNRTIYAYAMGRLVSPSVRRVAQAQTSLSRYRHSSPMPGKHSYPQPSLAQSPGMDLEVFAAATAARCALRDEPFKQAKGRVVQGFEKAYLSAVLGRYGGNITQAARAANKHRRAFWELVRKHHIDISQYRTDGQTQLEPDSDVPST